MALPFSFWAMDEVAELIIIDRRVEGLSAQALDRFVLRARCAVRLRGSVNILLTGNAAMRSLNLRFRKKDKPTDVLSFPSRLLMSQNGTRPFAGEIAISAEIAHRNAARLGHSPAVEVKVLALHGILHLAGFDHERDNGEMERKEANLRRSLGLPSSLTERGEPQRGLPTKPLRRSRSEKARRMA